MNIYVTTDSHTLSCSYSVLHIPTSLTRISVGRSVALLKVLCVIFGLSYDSYIGTKYMHIYINIFYLKSFLPPPSLLFLKYRDKYRSWYLGIIRAQILSIRTSAKKTFLLLLLGLRLEK